MTPQLPFLLSAFLILGPQTCRTSVQYTQTSSLRSDIVQFSFENEAEVYLHMKYNILHSYYLGSREEKERATKSAEYRLLKS